MKVAILYLCSGDYSVFWKNFYKSYEKKFLTESYKEYFVFTDKDNLYYEDKCERIHKIYQENLGWPNGTLLRFRMFSKIKEQLKNFDYIFFMNANLVCKAKVTEDELFNNDANLYAFQQPGYYNVKPKYFPYDRNNKCWAYVPYNYGEIYVFGAINGGKSKAYIKLIETLNKNVDEDIKKGIYAKWLDESYLNRYIINRNDVKVFSPSYCYPEGSNLPFETKIEVLDKSKFFNVDKIKNFKNNKNKYISKISKFYNILYVNINWIKDIITRKRLQN